MRIFLILSILVITSCTYNELSICETDNPSFTYCVEPIFEKNCIGCHFQNNSNGIMPLSNFQEIRDNVINGTVIDRISREETDILFMPKSSSKLLEEEIQIIINWKENGTPNN
jgi:hypothetical protein